MVISWRATDGKFKLGGVSTYKTICQGEAIIMCIEDNREFDNFEIEGLYYENNREDRA